MDFEMEVISLAPKKRATPGEFIVLKNNESKEDGKRSVGTETEIHTKSVATQTDPFVPQVNNGESQEDSGEASNHVSPQVEESEESPHADPNGSQNEISDLDLVETEKTSVFSFSCTYSWTHFNIMHYVGLHRWGNEKGILSRKSLMNLAAFVLTNLVAIFWEIGLGKHYMLSREKKNTVFYFITLWFYLHSALVSLFFVKLVAQNSATAFFNNVEEIKRKENKVTKRKVSKISVGLTILNVLISVYVASGANYVLFKDYGYKDVMIFRANQFTSRVLYWQTENYNERLDQFDNVTKAETEHVILGTAEMGLRFIGWMHYSMVKDTVLVSAMELYFHTNEFKALLEDTRNDPITLPLLGKLEHNWKILHQVSNDMENQFGGLFNIIAVDNWLFGAYVLLGFMDENFKFDGIFIAYLAIMSKNLIAYILAAIAKKTGPMLKRQVSTNSPSVGSADDMVIKANIGTFERKIDNMPVQMGAGNFLVDESFVYKYIGSVAASAVGFRDHQKKDEEA